LGGGAGALYVRPAVVHVFVLTLGYSRRAWAEGYENARLSALRAIPTGCAAKQHWPHCVA